MSSAELVDKALRELDDLHRAIDREVLRLSAVHASRLNCRRGCSACCLDDLRVTRIEAEKIRRGHAALLADFEPHTPGACAFLDEFGACRIYESRPTICRSQGLPLRVIFENEAEEIEERRDICPLNLEDGPPLEALSEEDCWLVGPQELRVRQLDDEAFGRGVDGVDDGVDGEDDRIRLRDLFRRR